MGVPREFGVRKNSQGFSTNDNDFARVGCIMRDFPILLVLGRGIGVIQKTQRACKLPGVTAARSQNHRRVVERVRRAGDQNGSFPRFHKLLGATTMTRRAPLPHHGPVKRHAGRGKRQNAARLSAVQQTPRAPPCTGSCYGMAKLFRSNADEADTLLCIAWELSPGNCLILPSSSSNF